VTVTVYAANNLTTVSSVSNPTLIVDYLAPTVTDTNISISGATGTGGTYKIGDTVTATWNNTLVGNNNTDVSSGVTVDFSAFGGGAAVSASNNNGTYTATYVIAAGAVDGTNKNVLVTATDNAGNTTTTADTSNAAVDNMAPTLTVSGVALSADTGFSNSDRITQTAAQTITATLSGALSAGEVLYGSIDNGSNWTNITSMLSTTAISWTGVTLSGGSNIVFRITDSVGNNSANTGSSSYVVDFAAPTVTDANISISGATGTSGTYKIGDTVTATWNNTAGGDNNTGALSGVTVDFSAFGGGAAVSASNNSGTYTASYVIAAGSVEGTNKNVSVTATDSAGNTTSRADTTNATVDNMAPTLTVSGVTLSADTGISNSDRITQTAAQTITATLSGALGAGEVLYGSIDNGTSWTNITSMLSTTAISWTGVTLSGSSNIVFRITDSVGNNGANTGSSSYVLDVTRPSFSLGSIVYTASTNTLVLSAGGNLTTLLQAGEASATDIKERLDWSKLSWDINGDDAITTDVSFALTDISSVVTNSGGNRLTIVLTADKATSLEANAGYGGAIEDKLDIAAGFFRDVAGNTATATLSKASLLHTGQSVIDLVSSGKLIAPVQVEGQWYYYWDRSGDGTVADTGTRNGGIDRATHDQLDLLFTKDSSGATGGAGNTTDTYRYATINGVAVALPTATLGLGTNLNGTSYSDAGATSNGTTSITYDSLLAVWDAFNGTGTGTGLNGTPPGWFSGNVEYWSASPGTSADTHVAVQLINGAVASTSDTASAYVALMVL
jgi:hypothetical protein